MAYHLAQNPANHIEVLRGLLQDMVDHSDLVIVSKEGEKVVTSSLLLSIFSPTLTAMMESVKSDNSNIVALSLPLPCGYIRNLVTLLSTGFLVLTRSDGRELEGLTQAAELLNIDLGNLEIIVQKKLFPSGVSSAQLIENNVDDHDTPVSEENRDGFSKLVIQEGAGAGKQKINHGSLVKYEQELESKPYDLSTSSNYSKQKLCQDRSEDYICFVKQEYGQESIDLSKSFSDGSEQYPCGQCGKSFKNKKHLDRHLVTHSGRFYSCDNCDRVFTRNDKLTDHKRAKHLGGICCIDCGASFSRQDKLNSHRRRKHFQTCY